MSSEKSRHTLNEKYRSPSGSVSGGGEGRSGRWGK